MEPRTVSTSSPGISARNRDGREARSCCSLPKMRRYTARVRVSDLRARVIPTYTSRRSSSMPFSSFSARLCGEMPSSIPVRNTWSNSRPLVLCKVINVTPGLPSKESASLTRAAASKKSVNDSPFSMPSATARTSSSRFSIRETSSGVLRSRNISMYPVSSRTARKKSGASFVASASCSLAISSWNARRGATARPDIQYAQQRNVIFRMHGQPNIGQRVLHFRAVVETKTSHELVAEPTAAKYLFKRSRLKIRAVFHRASLRGAFTENALEFAGDKFRLRVRVSALEIFQGRSGAIVRAERLAQPLGIVGHHRASGVEDLLRRAVIALQLDDASRREIPRKTHQDGNVRAAPAVDGLVFVADDADVLLRAGKKPEQLILHPVGVLVLVHVNVLKTRLPLFAHRHRFPQQFDGTSQQIIEIESVASVQQLFVGGVDVGNTPAVLVDGLAAHLLRALAMILRVADAAQNISRRQRLVIDLQVRHDQFHRRELVIVVVNGEIAWQPGIGCFSPKQARTQRMKGGQPRLRGRHAGAEQQVGDAVSHFLRGLIRERDRKNRLGRHAAGDKLRHSERDGARLARSGAGQNQQRPFRRFRRCALFRIQLVKKSQHGSRGGKFSCTAMLAEGSKTRKLASATTWG